MIKTILNFFLSFASRTPKGLIGETGAELNNDDNRDIKYSDFAQARLPQKLYITDLDIIPVEDQKDKGTCVGQAEGTAVEYYIYKILGKVVGISRRFIYAASKIYDLNKAQGTLPRIAAMVIVKHFGAAEKSVVPDDNDLPYEKYIDVKLTGAVLESASQNKLPGVAFLDADEYQIATAIEDHGVITATLPVDISKWYVAFIMKIFRIDSYHRVSLIGHVDIGGDRRFYFRNSWSKNWGTNGMGYFNWSDYKDLIRDIQVYTEIPKELLEKARSTNYLFNKNLSMGSEGIEVYKLQKRLQKEGYLKGVDIAGMEPYYGHLTASALLMYQLDNAIDDPETLRSLRGEYFGGKTRNKMNNTKVATQSLLTLWGQAIQSFEGWYPGSQSYRHNNPGNLRYSPLESGNINNFSVFSSYTVGFTALTNLLKSAATGGSKIYNPEMTLLDFYNRYAPSADNNHPQTYANYVAKIIGVPVTTKIKNLI